MRKVLILPFLFFSLEHLVIDRDARVYESRLKQYENEIGPN